jgi:hypothetical protein
VTEPAKAPSKLLAEFPFVRCTAYQLAELVRLGFAAKTSRARAAVAMQKRQPIALAAVDSRRGSPASDVISCRGRRPGAPLSGALNGSTRRG